MGHQSITLYRKRIATTIIIFLVEELESNVPLAIPSIIEIGVDIAFHLMKQIQIIHQLVKNIASTTLHPPPPTNHSTTQNHNMQIKEKKIKLN